MILELRCFDALLSQERYADEFRRGLHTKEKAATRRRRRTTDNLFES